MDDVMEVKGRLRLGHILRFVGLLVEENPCGWGDSAFDAIAEGVSVLVDRKTGAGLTMLQMAEYFKVTIRTLERWRVRFEDFPKPIDPYAKTLLFPVNDVVYWKIAHERLGDI